MLRNNNINMYHHEPGVYELHKANAGSLRFQVRYPMGNGFASFSLTSKNDPTKDIYQVYFGSTYRLLDRTKNDNEHMMKKFHLVHLIGTEFQEFWLTWHNNVICLGVDGQRQPIVTYTDEGIMRNNIGFIKFYTKSVQWPVEWKYEESPVILKSLKEKRFSSDKLIWVVPADDGTLPPDALIAGFQNEPIYVARALHNNAYTPGKYIHSIRMAYIPWGTREHQKGIFEILCGFNASWVKTQGSFIPGNAFKAGTSEIRQEPLYIGRAMIGNNLIVGKVHPIYERCYLPFEGREIEVDEYEILVTDDEVRGVLVSTEKQKMRRRRSAEYIF